MAHVERGNFPEKGGAPFEELVILIKAINHNK